MKHDKNKLLIDYYLDIAILKIQEEYKLKYNTRVVVPDRIEIMQRHSELVSAIFTHLSRTKAKIIDADGLLDD